MSRYDIYGEIEKEREHQDHKWGGPDHDDKHGDYDWIAFIVKHLGRAVQSMGFHRNYRDCMLRVAALAVAAVEAHDRKYGRYTRVTPP